ncbi:uncharacterized protein DNG_07285 [Cephalotrichum gorgonifer]|uniref:Bacteriophage T5 Orf172 DNA-binding domain-containing protein n=1 Tax=Cephalotrichum gorgonifer TaxID=2041049 RepID=A0AAE8N4B8_9PEZI|nr:uncharacterized protein DNG_07285 [Cephalotrichum gorgonifer]
MSFPDLTDISGWYEISNSPHSESTFRVNHDEMEWRAQLIGETGEGSLQDSQAIADSEQAFGSDDGGAHGGWASEESGGDEDGDVEVGDGDVTLCSDEASDEDGDDNGDETDCEDEIVVATEDSYPSSNTRTRPSESVARSRSAIARVPEFQTPSSTNPEGDSLLQGATLVDSNPSRLALTYDTLDLQPEEGENAPSPEPPHNIPSPPGKAGDQFPYIPGVGWIDLAPRYSDTKKIIARIEKKYSKTESQLGVVYILKHKNYKNLFKVGTTKREMEERLSDGRVCEKDNSEVVYLPETTFWGAARAEALVKADMVNRNLAIRTCQHCSTPKSIRSHTEWFKTSPDDVQKCVEFWEDFVKKQCDEDGFRGNMVSVLKQVLLAAGASSPSSTERSRRPVEKSEEPSPSLGRAGRRPTPAINVDSEEEDDDDDTNVNKSSEAKEPTQKHMKKGSMPFSSDKTVTNNVALEDIPLPKIGTRSSKRGKPPVAHAGRGITKPATRRITSSAVKSVLVPIQAAQAPV